jgi:hypothetical protein
MPPRLNATWARRFHLWPLPSADDPLGATIHGFHDVLELIWRNQNPPDCSVAQFLIAEHSVVGFGSVVQQYSSLLSIALAMGRVLLMRDDTHTSTYRRVPFVFRSMPVLHLFIYSGMQANLGKPIRRFVAIKAWRARLSAITNRSVGARSRTCNNCPRGA